MVMPDHPSSNVPVIAASEEDIANAQTLASRWHLPFAESASAGLVLWLEQHTLSLRQLDEPKLGGVVVDFASDTLTYRKEHGGGKKEAIAKACGVKGDKLPRIIDGTAGLGRDAFVLAALGCKVDMIERSPVVGALLENGLLRAKSAAEVAHWLPQRMQLYPGRSMDLLAQWPGEQPDVIYLDPMFPHRKKSAAVKKEMRLFQQLLGPDEDADAMLAPALKLAKHRVVVKRPDSAPYLADQKPSMAIESKKHRFDVYLTS